MLALNFALGLLRHGQVEKIVYLRNPINFKKYGSEGIGYLKGDQDDKMVPLLKPIMDNLEMIVRDEGKRNYMIRTKQIEALPIEFIQGRSFRNAFIIVDEAQNIAPELMHLILTRISEGSKMVVIGGCRKGTKNNITDGLSDALDRFADSENIATYEFDPEDEVPRHYLTKEINDAYLNL